MNLSNWIRFRWDLTQLPKFDFELPEHYEIGAATAEDETELRKVISSSFVLDPTWNPATGSDHNGPKSQRRRLPFPTTTDALTAWVALARGNKPLD